MQARIKQTLNKLLIIIQTAFHIKLSDKYIFQPFSIETFGSIISTAVDFLSELDRRIGIVRGDTRESSYVFQRISVIVERFNSVLLHDGFIHDEPDL